jgi:hypothetical protein
LQELITVAEIGEVMNMPISLTFGEILTASPDLAAHVSEQACKRRHPIENTSANTVNTAKTAETVSSAQVNSIVKRLLYTCLSSRVTVILVDTLKVEALCDDRSEINLICHRNSEKLNIPINSDIEWTIDGDAAAKEVVGSSQLLGVCYKTNVGGVIVTTPVFVVEAATADLILGNLSLGIYMLNTSIKTTNPALASSNHLTIVRCSASSLCLQNTMNCSLACRFEHGSVGTE